MNVVKHHHLRLISLTEGVSYILLLGIGMPLKYGIGILLVNKVMGMIHGLLTILLCIILVYFWITKKLEKPLILHVFIASLIPFGAFFIDQKLKKLS